MKNSRIFDVRRFGLMLALVCLFTMPAFGGTAKPIPTGPFDADGKPSVPDYNTTANWANSPPLVKFVDTLPGLGSTKANNLGQYLSVGKPDTLTYPGSDYYEIDLVEYNERMHSDLPLPGTLLRGYVQVNKGTNIAPGTLPSAAICGTTGSPVACANTVDPDGSTTWGQTLSPSEIARFASSSPTNYRSVRLATSSYRSTPRSWAQALVLLLRALRGAKAPTVTTPWI